MTYSLRTLNSASGTSESDSKTGLPEGSGLLRFTQEIFLFVGAAGLLVLTLAMFSFSPKDPSWSGSGLCGLVGNWMGPLGAWLADGMYFCFG
jgi:S-DNA-T family DNA segregation ATPase FtsK/SpoIIIE